ncbi:hypothetical protein [Mesorhizobium sp. B2-4-14]|uniref:hypothetical protein n=1 Tax=Mesorhizobium sp. B2-4-14 TaxID=2589935 RepID=UPI001FEFF1D3|nr:hypothetical protein [Mesorhizobium sp. B2-4-14]
MTRGLPRTLARAAREAGIAPPKLGLKAVTTGQGGSYRTVFTFAGMQVPVTDALAMPAKRSSTFPTARCASRAVRPGCSSPC